MAHINPVCFVWVFFWVFITRIVAENRHKFKELFVFSADGMMEGMKLVPRIAIDFGSHMIRVVADDTEKNVFSERSLLVRKVVSGEILAIGEAAEDHVLVSGEELVAPIRNGIMVDYEGASALIAYVLRQIASWWHVFKPHVVIAESLSLSRALSQALGEVVQVAGGGKVYMTPVPSLAALGAGIDPRDSVGNLILDIGAGTTEAAIISRGSSVSATSAPIGGYDLSQAVVVYLENKYGVDISDSTAADIIQTGGSALRRDDDGTHEFYANEKDTGEAKVLTITGNEITEVIAKPLQQILGTVSWVVHRTPTTLLSDIAQNGITVTGGVGNLRHVDTYLKRELALPVRVVQRPEDAVISGGREALRFVSRFKQTVPQSSA